MALSLPRREENADHERLRLPGVGLATAGSPDGKPVIFLHGWGGCRAVWDSVLAHCPEGLKFLALDLPGTGGSARLPVYTIPALAKWVLDTADRLELSSFMLAGHSMGGNVAACAAGLAPGRVEKLVLVDAALYSDRVHRAKYCLHPVSGHATLALARAGAGALAAMGLVFRDHGRGGHWRPYFRRNRYVVAANSHTGMHSHLKALVAHPFDMRSLPKDLPVLIMHGKRDQVIPFAFAEEMLASRPHNTALIAYPNAMHCPMDTSPARFSRDIAAFLQGGLEAT